MYDTEALKREREYAIKRHKPGVVAAIDRHLAAQGVLPETTEDATPLETAVPPPVKRGRGRPRKNPA